MIKLLLLIRQAFLFELFKIKTKKYLFSFNLWIILCIIIMITFIYSMLHKLYIGEYFNFITDLLLFSISFVITHLIYLYQDK